MNYSPRGTRKAGRVIIGEPIHQSDINLIRSAIQHCIQYWGACYMLMLPDGECVLRKRPPVESKYFVGTYCKKFSTHDIRADLYQAMADFGRPVAHYQDSQQKQLLSTDAQECATDG